MDGCFRPIAAVRGVYETKGNSLQPLLAFSLGLSAPTTIQAMIAKTALTPGPLRLGTVGLFVLLMSSWKNERRPAVWIRIIAGGKADVLPDKRIGGR